MARRALILIEGARGNSLHYAQAARRLGLHPIFLSADSSRYDYFAAKGIEAIRVDTSSFDALIRECSRLGETYDITGITSASELVYATVGTLCRHFDLPGPNPGSNEQRSDKITHRQLLAKAGVPVPAYRLAANLMEIESAAAEIGAGGRQASSRQRQLRCPIVPRRRRVGRTYELSVGRGACMAVFAEDTGRRIRTGSPVHG